jgi:predicted dehydrogenase
MRLGIIGCGAISMEVHLPSSRRVKGVTLGAVVDKDPDWTREVARRFGVRHSLTRYDELVGRVDAAIVATPNWTHVEIASFLLEHGIHVLCEKPLAFTVAEAQQVFAIALRYGTRIMAGYSRRFTDNAQAFHTLMRLESFGRVDHLTAALGMPLEHWPARELFRTDARLSGGGCLMDSGIHLIDLALWLVGRHANVREYAQWENRKWGIEDDAVLTLAFDCGTLARLASSYTHELSAALTITGTEGWARMPINGESGAEFLARGGVIGRSGGVQQIKISGTSPHEQQLRHFVECVESGEPFLVRSEDVLEGLRIIEACYDRPRTRDT